MTTGLNPYLGILIWLSIPIAVLGIWKAVDVFASIMEH